MIDNNGNSPSSKYADFMEKLGEILWCAITLLCGVLGGIVGNVLNTEYVVAGIFVGLVVGFLAGCPTNLLMLYLGELGKNAKITAEAAIKLAEHAEHKQ